jgi:IclR family pca regulon transcriptional regulator
VAIGLGSRFPAFQTSMGRVLLSERSDDEVRDIFDRSDRSRATETTVADVDSLLDRLADVRANGWALVDQELEVGVRSIAAPIRGAAGCALAAVNISTHAGRVELTALHREYLPALLDTSAQISDALALR